MNLEDFDSKEEWYFSWYLEELKKKGYIDEWDAQSVTFELTGGFTVDYIKPMKRVEDKVLKQVILNPSTYTPDFRILWSDKAFGIFATDLDNTNNRKIDTPFISKDRTSIVEIKGGFDSNNMTRLANNNIKFVWEKHLKFINMIKVPQIFNKTFTPEKYFKTDKSGKPRKIKYKNKIYLSDFIESKLGL